jgi:hypothetical protein
MGDVLYLCGASDELDTCPGKFPELRHDCPGMAELKPTD